MSVNLNWTDLPVEVRLYILDYTSLDLRPLVCHIASLDNAHVYLRGTTDDPLSSTHGSEDENAFTRAFKAVSYVQDRHRQPHSPLLNAAQVAFMCRMLYGSFSNDPAQGSVYCLWRNMHMRGLACYDGSTIAAASAALAAAVVAGNNDDHTSTTVASYLPTDTYAFADADTVSVVRRVTGPTVSKFLRFGSTMPCLLRLDLQNSAISAAALQSLLQHNSAITELRAELLDSGAHTFLAARPPSSSSFFSSSSSNSGRRGGGGVGGFTFTTPIPTPARRGGGTGTGGQMRNVEDTANAAATITTATTTTTADDDDDDELRGLHPLLQRKILHKRRRQQYKRQQRQQQRRQQQEKRLRDNANQERPNSKPLHINTGAIAVDPQRRVLSSFTRYHHHHPSGSLQPRPRKLRLKRLTLDIDTDVDGNSDRDIIWNPAPSRTSAQQSFLAIISQCPELEELRLGTCWSFDIDADVTKAIAQHCPQLRVLDLPQARLNTINDKVSVFLAWNNTLSHLQSLGITQGHTLPEDLMALANHPSLTELMLPPLRTDNHDRVEEAIVALVKRNKTRALGLAFIQSVSAALLDKIVSQPTTQLRTLALTFPPHNTAIQQQNWQDRHTQLLLNHSPHLEDLFLEGDVAIHVEGARALAGNKTLKRLVVSRSPHITNAEAAILFTSTSLHSLSLRGCTSITDSLFDAPDAATAIVQNMTLQCLDMSETNIGDRTVSAILYSDAHIHTLVLSQCHHLTDEVIVALNSSNMILRHLVLDNNPALCQIIRHETLETLSLCLPPHVSGEHTLDYKQIVALYGESNNDSRCLPRLQRLFIHEHAYAAKNLVAGLDKSIEVIGRTRGTLPEPSAPGQGTILLNHHFFPLLT